MRSTDNIIQTCRQESLLCLGTSAVFERRAKTLRNRLRSLTFLGIAVPSVVGAAFMAFGAKSSLTGALLGLASLLGLVQVIGSIWSLTYRWDDDFAYAMESMSANRSFHEKFKSLADNLPSSAEEADFKFEILQTESNSRSEADMKQHVTEDEKRYGLRAALRNLHSACTQCKQIPTSLTPSNCDICGNFRLGRF